MCEMRKSKKEPFKEIANTSMEKEVAAESFGSLGGAQAKSRMEPKWEGDDELWGAEDQVMWATEDLWAPEMEVNHLTRSGKH